LPALGKSFLGLDRLGNTTLRAKGHFARALNPPATAIKCNYNDFNFIAHIANISRVRNPFFIELGSWAHAIAV
jgi:hypothetical protein